MTIAVVQTVGVSGGPVSSLTTGGITTTNGNLVIFDECNRYGVTSFSSVSDNGTSNSWTSGVSVFQNTGDSVAANTEGREYYNPSINGKSGHTFTVTMAGSGAYIGIAITEVSGADASPLDQTATLVNDLSGNTTHTCTATSTTTQAAELWHGFGFNNVFNFFHTYSVTTPWTQGVNISDVTAGACGLITGDQVVSSTGTAAFVFADSALGADKFGMSTSTWKAATGGGGNVVSGGATEGADTTSGSIKVAVKASGGPTEGPDATSGTIKVAVKVSGGVTEGKDATAGSVKVALKVSGGPTEGADSISGSISVGSTHVSGAITEGADATGGGSIKVAVHASGGPTEGPDATSGSIKLASKVSGGVTEGADAISGSITATSRNISGGMSEGADAMSGQIISGTVSQGGHFLPLTKKEIAAARKRAKAARDAEQAGWDQAAKDKADLHKQIMATLHPEKILGPGKPIETVEEDDDEADIEMLLLYG